MKLGIALTTLALAGIGMAQGKKPTMHTTQMKAGMNAHAAKPMSKADWQKMYNLGAKMFDKKDADGLFSMMTPDFTMSMQGKTMKAEEAKAGMKQWFGMMKDMHCKMTVTKVSGSGNMVRVTDNFDNWGMSMPDPKTHKSGKYRDWGTETATWVKVGGKWMMKKLVSEKEHMTLNGKPFKPQM